MIELKGPHMALNSKDYWARYQMWNSWEIPLRYPVHNIMSHVGSVARNAPGNSLLHLVFSCHGWTGKLDMGSGFNASNVHLFNQWKDLVKMIWILGCKVAGSGGGDIFCGAIARNINGYVVASDERQIVNRWDCPNNPTKKNPVCLIPYGRLDDFEGEKFVFDSNGVRHEYSTFVKSMGASVGILADKPGKP